MKIEKRELKYHITLLNGDHVDLLMKEYVGVTNLVIAIARDEKTWTIDGHELFTDSSVMIPLLMEVTRGSTADSWEIFNLILASE